MLAGAAVAALLWALGSAAFGWYVATLGNYTATYGSLATVVVVMTWLWVSAAIVLFGAQINYELGNHGSPCSNRLFVIGERGNRACRCYTSATGNSWRDPNVQHRRQDQRRRQRGVGKAKEATRSSALDDDRMQAEGLAQQAKGNAQKAVGDAKDAVKNTVDKV